MLEDSFHLLGIQFIRGTKTHNTDLLLELLQVKLGLLDSVRDDKLDHCTVLTHCRRTGRNSIAYNKTSKVENALQWQHSSSVCPCESVE